jgi:hypothetical protein
VDWGIALSYVEVGAMLLFVRREVDNRRPLYIAQVKDGMTSTCWLCVRCCATRVVLCLGRKTQSRPEEPKIESLVYLVV